MTGAASEAFPGRAGVRCRGRACNPRSGGFGHHPSGTMTGARGAFAGLGQAGVGNAPLKKIRKTCPATSQEAWPEAESLAMKDSLGREPRWNADRCAPGDPGAAVAASRGRIPIASVGVSPPTLLLLP